MADTSFVLFTLGPVQSFIKAARTVRDLWSGSYLLSYLTFRAMKAVAEQSGRGAEAIVFPDVTQLPLWQWEAGVLTTNKKHTVLEPCIPNRFLAEVRGDEEATRKLADAAKEACEGAWKEIAEDVRRFLFTAHGHESFAEDKNRKNLWHQQIDTFFEVYTAALPASATADQIRNLLGTETANPWADRHQVAQKMLAAVKNRRHFPVYAPKFDGDVPQKDTLLGTLEHMGPGNRRASTEFWATAAKPKGDGGWHFEGSKVTSGERLCAVSLVKRFAWAHHFAPQFGYEDRRALKFQDTATVAAAKWLCDPKAANPREKLARKELWSGQWLHWPDRYPPNDDLDEDDIPPAAWDAIRAKKGAQGKPPTYYAMFVFDGDKIGDRFSAATGGDAYRKLSGTLGNFALKVIQRIVERSHPEGDKPAHHGELIYAGGDDAICVLPTETALACVREINDAFRANWGAAFPNEEAATISGGLVIAHYKEDLRFVIDEAHKAEKRSKDAGRDALTVTVCRRSGEHSSAVVPWDFVPTVGGWVEGFLKKASDRWAYKLRGDLPVFEDDPGMFKSELKRQLKRAEDATSKHFAAGAVVKQFGDYSGLLFEPERQELRKSPATDKDAITDFITLLQSASFLARGRDA